MGFAGPRSLHHLGFRFLPCDPPNLSVRITGRGNRLQWIVGVPTTLATVALIGFYFVAAAGSETWPGGGSPAGLICGIAAGAIIGFEMLLWPRKLLRRLRLIPAKYWMAAHLWLGIASLPLAIVHCGFHLGGWLPTTFMIVFLLTIASGIYGLVMQHVLPRMMLRRLPSETIYNQIGQVSRVHAEDARRLVTAVAGPRHDTDTPLDFEPALVDAPEPVVVGAVRETGRVRGRTLRTRKFARVREDAAPLWKAFDELHPYLVDGRAAVPAMGDVAQADRWFDRLAAACSEESRDVIASLRAMCEQRRQFDLQATMHRHLHVWLPLHIAFSIATTILLLVHIVTALQYW